MRVHNAGLRVFPVDSTRKRPQCPGVTRVGNLKFSPEAKQALNCRINVKLCD